MKEELNITMDAMKIITEEGNIPLMNLTAGMKVYEYYNCHLHEIVGFKEGVEKIVEVTFNDGRVCYYTESEFEILKDAFSYKHDIMFYGEKYDLASLNPDPYVAGAFLFWGDTTDEYLNLPFSCTSLENQLYSQYGLQYANVLNETGKVYFKRKGDHSDTKLKWEDIFPNHMDHIRNNMKDDNVFPIVYERCWIADRFKLIRGIFDVAYNKKETPEDISVKSKSAKKMEYLQFLLLSAGLTSDILHNSERGPATIPTNIQLSVSEMDYTAGTVNIALDIKEEEDVPVDPYHYLFLLGKNSMYPGLFYNIETMENMIDNYFREGEKKYIRFRFEISKVRELPAEFNRVPILDKEKVCYLTDDFLPKFSA